jgi:hypothetical protein
MAEHTTNNDTFIGSVRDRMARYDDNARVDASADGSKGTESPRKKKGIWARFTDRLKGTHCTMTPPECR